MYLLAQVDKLQLPSIEYITILPALILIGGALVILTISALVPRRMPEAFWTTVTLLTCGATAIAAVAQWFSITGGKLFHVGFLGIDGFDITQRGARPAIAQAVVLDGFSLWFALIAASCVALFALIADGYVQREGLGGPEIYVLALLSSSGTVLMAEANDLLVLFLGLEILSISLYVLAGFHRRKTTSGEAAMKYFILGAFSSAIFLYGIALTYGATGSTRYDQISKYLQPTENETAAGALYHAVGNRGLVLTGMVLLLVGLGFKVAAVPFHAWTPDVYQGSPTPVTGFMAGAAKAAGFAGLIRLLVITFGGMKADWRPAIWALAVLTLVVGSVLALSQTDVKRMLAYSSINHAGYVLVGLWASGSSGRNAIDGVTGAQYYLLTYAFIVLGSFAVVSVVSGQGDDATAITDYKGLYQRKPFLAVSLTLLLAAQAGVPFTTGFWAKFAVIKAALTGTDDTGLAITLTLVAMLVTAVSAYFYLRLILTMFQPPEGVDEEHLSEPGTVAVLTRERAALVVPVGTKIAISISLLMTIGAGLWAGPLLDFAARTLGR
jgi:NADH-quinone oxidoreductase subunit N